MATWGGVFFGVPGDDFSRFFDPILLALTIPRLMGFVFLFQIMVNNVLLFSLTHPKNTQASGLQRRPLP